MKRYTGILFLFFACIVRMTGAESNILSVPDVTAMKGQAISLPFYIDNTSGITALQFTLETPEGVSINANTIALSDRKADHQIAFKQNGTNTCTLMVYSPGNKPFSGQSGQVLSIGIQIPEHYEEGQVYPLAISDAVLCLSDGTDVLTNLSVGSIRIAKCPDLIAVNLLSDKQNYSPEENISLSWQVENIGDLPTQGGWKEQVFLTSGDNTKLIGTTYFNQSLAAGGSVSRQATLLLPKLMGIDGSLTLQVKIIPNADAGEGPEAQANNLCEAAKPVYMEKLLYLTIPNTPIDENTGAPLKCSLSRSGDWSKDEAFAFQAPADTRIELPESVVIPAQQASVVFYITIKDNDRLDDITTSELTLSGNDYQAVSANITIQDDELPALTLSASDQVWQEGKTFSLLLTRERVTAEPLIVSLSCDHPKRFEFDNQAVIPAGEGSISIHIVVKDDKIPDVEIEARFTVTAENYLPASCSVVLEDDDLPEIELLISPDRVSESAGAMAVIGTLRRLSHSDSPITVNLSDDSGGGLYYSSSKLSLAAGVQEAKFTIGIVDNALVDGTREVEIEAAIYLASCNCSADATGAGLVKQTLTILDDDGPSLQIVPSQTVLPEGKTDATVLTISRNTSVDNALTIHLSSNYDADLVYTQSVVIPAGSLSVDVVVSVKANDIAEGDRTVSFTAEAEGYSAASCWGIITDLSLPDALIPSLTIAETQAEVGSIATLGLTIRNEGVTVLPANVPVNIYAGSRKSTFYTSQRIEPGKQLTISNEITLPDTPGAIEVYAVINENQGIDELLYLNNTSESLSVTLLPKFTATVSADKRIYRQGETVTINGKIAGNGTSRAGVEVYLINDGIRQTLTTVSDVEGNFRTVFEPALYQSGHFILGACYPNEELTTEQTSFDIYGIKRTEAGYITHDILIGEPFNGSISLKNSGGLALSDLRVEIVSIPENRTIDFEPIALFNGGATANLNYVLQGTSISEGNDWEQIRIRILSNESKLFEETIHCYFRSPQGQLKADIPHMHTTMIKGMSRDYPFTITNIGKGETGKISLSLPQTNWMKTVTPVEMASLQQGDSATLILRLTPTDDMPLNVPIAGTIGINCENGNGIALPFLVEPVSETTGTLLVDVCDEYTYYTAEAPHLAGARVIIKHPTTNAVLYEGLTGTDGLFTVTDIPEGYYGIEVTAEKHDSYKNNILIDPGRTTTKVVNLSYQAVTISWEVVETEIEDEYEIKITTEYETNVPRPVVEAVFPEDLEFKDQVFVITATNKGLIAAHDVVVTMPELEEISFEVLSTNPIPVLAPQQSVQFFVKMTINDLPQPDGIQQINGPHHIIGCIAGIIGLYYTWYCGLENEKIGSAMANYAWGECSSILPDWFGGGGGSLGGPNGGGGGTPIGTGGGYSGPTIVRDCSECADDFKMAFVDCIVGFLPVKISCPWDVGRCFFGPGSSPVFSFDMIGCLASAALGCVDPTNITSILGCLKGLLDPCDYLGQLGGGKASGYPSYILDFQEKMTYAVKGYEAILETTKEIYGDDVWLEADKDELAAFYSYFTSLNPSENPVSVEELLAYKPANISEDALSLFVERWNNTRLLLEGQSISGGNYISSDNLERNGRIIEECEEKAVAYGYDSMAEMIEREIALMKERISEPSSSVCASVSLQFTQTMTMTRQAFRGTLNVYNGHESVAMENVKLQLEVKDKEGTIATSREFQINTERLDNFQETSDGVWRLHAHETGVATILFIPSKYAAPTEPKAYSFGGTLSYIDPFSGLEVTRDLNPVTLTVNPSPGLKMTYFMQRDILGDDPLTADVEPMVPGELSLLIENVGMGEAKNVKIVTQQPQIINNEKGLFIDFELLSSQLNGQEHTLALGGSVPANFGNILPGQTTYAQWWFTSSLLGHFVDYDVEATHVTSHDNPDLSLLDEVSIHELIRSIRIVSEEADAPQTGFLVNDILDANDMPDMLYLSDGSVEPVAYTVNTSLTPAGENQYFLNITPAAGGWNYGLVNDPVNGRQNLVAVQRVSDSQTIDLRNFWQTHVTLRDGKDPLYENKLHFIDLFIGGPESYLLTFEPKPDLILAVEAFEGAPQHVADQAVEALVVRFNKPVDETTFSFEDISLACQGEVLDNTKIAISKRTDREFELDISALTLADGYYVLTLQTADIKDTEGFYGEKGRKADWNQYIGGKVAFNAKALPADAGTFSPFESGYDYGSTVIIQAIPAEGYQFDKWTLDGNVLSVLPDLEYVLLSATTLNAHFSIQLKDITVSFDETQGRVVNGGTGKYEYGSQLKLKAIPNEAYIFEGWIVNGVDYPGEETMQWVVLEDMMIEAKFRRTVSYIYHLAEGWNWLSVNTSEELSPYSFLQPVIGAVERLVSQEGELINSAGQELPDGIEAGQTYKIKLNRSVDLEYWGDAADRETPILLKKGWNWIGYLPLTALDINVALSDLQAERGDVIKSHTDFSVFDAGSWTGTLSSLQPGEGYSYFSGSEKDLVYPSSKSSGLRAKWQYAPSVWDIHPNGYPDNMNVIAQLYDGSSILPGNTFSIGAFKDGECRGVGRYVDGYLFITIHGEQVNETLTFKVIENATGKQYDLPNTLFFEEKLVGSIEQPYLFDLSGITAIETCDSGWYLFPNPVRTTLTLVGNLPDVRNISIFSIDGTRLMSSDRLDENQRLDVSALGEGVYILVLINNEGISSYKFIKVN